VASEQEVKLHGRKEVAPGSEPRLLESALDGGTDSERIAPPPGKEVTLGEVRLFRAEDQPPPEQKRGGGHRKPLEWSDAGVSVDRGRRDGEREASGGEVKALNLHRGERLGKAGERDAVEDHRGQNRGGDGGIVQVARRRRP
jgi:hypothetical protein